MAPILCLLRRFEEPVKHQLMNTCRGRLMFNFCLCVDKDLPPAEQVEICHVIEANVLKVAASSGFIGVITNNTNPVTQVGYSSLREAYNIVRCTYKLLSKHICFVPFCTTLLTFSLQ